MATAAQKKAIAAAEAAEAEKTGANKDGTPATPEKASKKAKAGEVVSVATVKGVARFFRCGMQFGPEPVELVVADLEEGVLQRLQDEPRLVVTED